MRNKKFLESKGFYIVLALCVTSVGVAGYVNFFGGDDEEIILEPVTSNIVLEVPTATEIIPEPIIKEESEPIVVDNEPNEPTVIIEPVESVDAPIVEVTKKEYLYVRPIYSDVLISNSMDEMIKDVTMNDWRTHNATSYLANKGDAVFSIADGVVLAIETTDQYGTVVTISHTCGMITKTYGLESNVICKVDKNVLAGDVIGTAMGNFLAENKLDDHIKVEANKDGVNIDIETLF